MAVFNEPTKWQTSLVNSGDANTIPQSTPAGTGKASFKDGFPQITQIPLNAGGIAPDRKDFNGLFKVLGDSIFYMQNGGLWSYNSAFDYAVGRVVLYTDGNLYKCIQANGASSAVKAPTDAKYWQKIVIQSDYANFVTLNTVQTIKALKDFSVLPTSSVAPTDSAHLTNKWYVDTTKVSLNDSQTVAGTKTFSSSPLMPTATAGDSSAKGASTAFVQNAIAQLVPTGTILAFGGVTIPSGWLLCNGAGVSRSTFSNLFAKIGTTYGMGDGSTTFNIPDLRDRYIIGANTNALGTYIAEQLPTIRGEVGDYNGIQGGHDGALSYFSTGNPTLSKVDGGVYASYWSHVKFDAYFSNNTYTNNGHVYPASLALNFIIKA